MLDAALGIIAATPVTDGGSGSTSSGGDFDPTAWIALALSIFSILVTVLLRYLDGPRVRVRVRPVLLNVGLGGTYTYSGGRWPIPELEAIGTMRKPDPGEVIELAEIVIENAGRNAMTVYEVGFCWLGERTNDQWWRRRARHANVPTPIRPPHAPEAAQVFADGDRFRIQPSDSVTLLVNYWDAVRAQRPTPNGEIELRASVRVAGKRRLKKSPWKRRWHIPDDAVTSVGTSKTMPLRAVISRSIALSLLYAKSETLGDIYFISRSLEAALDGTWSDDWKTNFERLEQFEKNSSVEFLLYEETWVKSTLMFNLARSIDDYKDVIDWTDIAQPGLDKMFSAGARDEERSRKDAIEAGEPKGTSDGVSGPSVEP
jgi:hypothetical protein